MTAEFEKERREFLSIVLNWHGRITNCGIFIFSSKAKRDLKFSQENFCAVKDLKSDGRMCSIKETLERFRKGKLGNIS
jgi:hypothetical protein